MQLQSIKKSVLLLFSIATLVGCNTRETLQTYYVDNELKPGFQSLDIPTSFLDIEESALTEEQKAAYRSVDKLNMLSFIVTEDNKDLFELELAKVKTIFKDAKYEELIRGGNSKDGKFMVNFIGDENRLDELILFGYANDKGFAIVRILGDDMNATHLVQLVMSMENATISDAKVNEVMEFFK